MSKSNYQYPSLDSLFNSKLRVKVLKFLFRNYPVRVGVRELARIIQEPSSEVSREMKALEKMRLIKKS